MTEERATDSPPDEMQIPRESFWKLLPRRDLTKVVALLVVLMMIVSLKMRAGTIVRRLTDGLYGPSPAPASASVPGGAPRVRLEPAPKSP